MTRPNDRDRRLVDAYTENVGRPPVTLYPDGRAAAQWSYPRIKGVKVPRRNDEKAAFLRGLLAAA